MIGFVDIILLIAATEALVELWRKAAPIQPFREWLIRITPFLYSRRQQTHLMECNYCVSVYVGVLAVAVYFLMNVIIVKVIVIALAVHRLSNYLHLYFSLLRDQQMDIRVARNNRT
jgi:hypothetical protein